MKIDILNYSQQNVGRLCSKFKISAVTFPVFFCGFLICNYLEILMNCCGIVFLNIYDFLFLQDCLYNSKKNTGKIYYCIRRLRKNKNDESAVNTEEIEIFDNSDQKKLLSKLNYCVFPQDQATIKNILISTLSLRIEMLESGDSVKKCFPILLAHPKLVSF